MSGVRLRLRRLGVPLAPLWVLLLVLLLTTAASATVRAFVQQQQQARFEREVAAYQRELRQRFLGYESVLLAVRSAWEAVGATNAEVRDPLGDPALSSQQFARLVAGLGLGSRSPGVMNVGYAPVITAAQRPGYARQLPQVAGDPAARLHPSSSLNLSAPVTYLVPASGPLTTGDRSVLGYDMYSDPVRQQAIRRAVQGGGVRATGPLLLLNQPLAAQDRAGLILYLTVRSQGRVSGLVYLPLHISAVLPAAGVDGERLNLHIAVSGQPLNLPGGPPAGPAVPPARSGFAQSAVLNLAGQVWTLDFGAPPGFGQDAAAGVPWLVLGVGVLVSLLAALATQAQVRARRRAEQISRSLRLSQSRLERSRAEFEAVFRAMQDTAIFTDSSGQVLFANDALSGSFGLSPVELRGLPIAELHADARLLARLDALPGPHLVTTLFRRQRAGAGGAGAGGDTFYGELQRSRVMGEGGEVLGQLEVIRDVTERLQTERALRAGERRYQGVLEGMPQLVFLAGASGQVHYLNRRWWEYVGPRAGGPEGQGPGPEAARGASQAADHSETLLAAIHPDDRDGFTQQWRASLASGHELETEHRLRAASGQYRTFVTRARPIYAAPGQVQEWVGSSTDIDDQIYAELTSRLLADVGQVLSARQHPGTPAGEGAELADQPGAGPGSAAPDDAAPDDAAPGDAAPDVGLWQALTLMTARFADSAALWPGPDLPGVKVLSVEVPGMGVSAAPLDTAWGPAQAPVLVAGRARRLATSTDGLPLFSWLGTEVEGVRSRREVVTLQGERLHPLALSAVVLYPLLQQGAVLGVLGLGFRGPPHDRDLELGQELAQRVASALGSRQLLARLQAARASLQDLNDSLEQRVGERTLQLSEANHELEAFSYSVSHDLRTPLRHILGFADLLRREQAAAAPGTAISPKATRYLNVISESAERMSRLIDDLLEFSRTSRAELRRVPVDLGAVVRGSVQGLAPDQRDRQVQWDIGPLPTVVGDAGLLRQVFDNLLSNALKYTRTREVARIGVQAAPHGREVWISVRDNGVGFDPEYAAKLFGVFQRLHRTEDFEGTGIGLANVRRIVSRHGGRVWAESGLPDGPGAVFWLALPVEALSLEKRAGQPQDARPQDVQLQDAQAPRPAPSAPVPGKGPR